MRSALLLLLSLPFAVSIVCDNCIVYSGSQCVNYGDCNGNYCLYEYQLQSNGQTMLKKSCLNTPFVQFDDGTILTVYNECVSKTTGSYSYNVKLCNNGNYCNRDCVNPQPLPSTNTQVTCYSCMTTNGADCNSGTCKGNYCTYSSQRYPDGTTRLTKGCADTASLLFDDGTALTTIDTCTTRTTSTGSQYTAEICNTDYCNAGCSGGNPQYQPTVTCYSCQSPNAYDCTGNTCQGNYCIYERTTGTDGIPYVKRSCSLVPYIVYPDNSRTQNINECEYRNIGGIAYASEVCNSGSFCAKACNPASSLASSLLSFLVLPLVYFLRY